MLLCDSILKETPEPETRFATMCLKGELAFAQAGDDAKGLNAAAQVFSTLAQEQDVTLFWRNQALCKKAKCFERLGNTDAALAAYYDVVNTPPTARGDAEYFWFYKAGFEAARILGSQDQ